MPKARPAIPKETRRKVCIESGHRCAACGVPVPLELAHIIPWSRTKSHEPENLVCLCASCHQRADHEKWGTKTLKGYKEHPWVVRYANWNSNPCDLDEATRSIVIDLTSSDLNEHELEMLRYALAGFLRIDASTIRVTSKEKGSVKLTIQLPGASARKLLSAFGSKDPELLKRLRRFPIRNIEEVPQASDDAETPEQPDAAEAGVRLSRALIAASVFFVIAVLLACAVIWIYVDAYGKPKVNLAIADLSSETRSGDQPQTVQLHNAQPLFMILNLPAARRSQTYIAEVVPDSSEVPQWTSQALRETQEGIVTLQFPPGFLDAGRYRIILYGKSEAELSKLTEYDLRIEVSLPSE